MALSGESSPEPAHLEGLRQAYLDRDSRRYRAILGALLKEARALDAAGLRGRLAEILRIGGRRGFSGFEPVLLAYQARMAGRSDEYGVVEAREARVGLDAALPPGALDHFSPSGCGDFLQEFWAAFEGGHERTAEQWGRFYACSAGPPPDTQALHDGLILSVDAGEEFRFLLDRPSGVAEGFTAAIDPVPAFPIEFGSDGHGMALHTPPTFELPLSARTQAFTISVASGGSTTGYRIVLHVRLAVHGPSYALLQPGQGAPRPYVASGGPADCALLPPFASALPCGAMSWSWLGDPLPAGLALATWPDGTARLAGAVSRGASSSRGRIRVEQGAQAAEREVALQVAVHFAVDPATLLGPHEIVRGQTFRLDLPQAFGGDGANHAWQVDPASPGLLPEGLQLVQDGSAWRIEGVVSPDTPLGETTVRFRVTAPLSSAAAFVSVGFRLTAPFRVWTQNTYLRPPDIFTPAEIVALGLISIVGSTLAAIAAGIEAYYDLNVKNTDHDNEQRAAIIADRIQDRIKDFDIVALQEVFSDDNLDQITQGVAGQYWSLAGPEGGGLTEPGSSGLLLLARRTLARHLDRVAGPLARPWAYRAAFEHSSEVYAKKRDKDDWARKGFTLDVVHVGSVADEWIYVVNTHLQADPGNEDVRASQLQQLSAFLPGHTDARHPVLFMGDFNVPAGTDEYPSMLEDLGGPEDLFSLVHPNVEGITYDSEQNAYAHHWNNEVPPVRQRLDYLLVRQGSAYRITVDHIHVERDQVSTRLCRDPGPPDAGGWLLEDHQNQLRCYLSDHYGVVAWLRLVRA